MTPTEAKAYVGCRVMRLLNRNTGLPGVLAAADPESGACTVQHDLPGEEPGLECCDASEVMPILELQPESSLRELALWIECRAEELADELFACTRPEPHRRELAAAREQSLRDDLLRWGICHPYAATFARLVAERARTISSLRRSSR